MMKSKMSKVCHALGIMSNAAGSAAASSTTRNNERSHGSDHRSSSAAAVRPDRCDQDGQRNSSVSEAGYQAWMVSHPSALCSFDRMMSVAKGQRVVVFLDYDGTLSPIVDDPDLAFMSDAMRSAVRDVARYFPTAIVSGRSRNKVYEFVQLNDVYYAGSHGMDIMTPPRNNKPGDQARYQTRALDKKGNEVIIFQPAQEFLPEILEIFNKLEVETRTIEGVTMEDNMFCVSVHFRRAREEDYGLVEEKVKKVLENHSGRFYFTRGRKVLEVRPYIEWNKGNALEYLLETLGFADSNDVLPMYIGDDRTDEDAFKVIQQRGQGFPIIVSSKPRETRATHSLRDPSEVLSFLLRLARWRRPELLL